MRSRRPSSALVLTAFVGALSSGCGGSKEGAAPVPQAGPATGDSAGATKDEISLPKAWAMSDAISAADVGAITGETMTYFPEAGSKAQEGRPAAGFTVAGKDFSKITFYAVVGGGEKEFESTKGFAAPGSVVDVPGIGDKAYMCDFVTGATAIVVLKGQDVVRVDWQPKTYDKHDKVELGKKLAGKLLENLYK